MNGSFFSKEAVQAVLETLSPLFLIAAFAFGALFIYTSSTSKTGDLRIDITMMIIRDEFRKKWFTTARAVRKLFPASDPLRAQLAIDHLLKSGEIETFINPRSGTKLYRFRKG